MSDAEDSLSVTICKENPPKGRQVTKNGGGIKGGGEVKTVLLTLQKMRTACTWVKCTKAECGKWRYLPIKDPSLVEDKWECKDSPDQRYGECAAPEQWWDQGLRNKFVENRFTVGSLVLARMEGWPAWPAMVDDDPDTGDYFWTGIRGGRMGGQAHPVPRCVLRRQGEGRHQGLGV